MATKNEIKFISKIISRNIRNNFSSYPIPYKYVILFTYLCQSRCKTCNIWKIYQKHPNLIKKELTADEYKMLLQSIRNHALWINITGGEPFLRNDVDDIVIYASRTIKNLFLVNIPTNGLATETIVDKTIRILNEIKRKTTLSITISLDSIEENNYIKIRGVNGLKNVIKTFEELKNIEYAYDNFEVNFQTTISKLNYNDFKTIDYILKNSKTPIITFSNENKYFNNMGLNVDARKTLKRSEIKKVIQYIINHYPRKSTKRIVPLIFLKLAEKYFKNPYKQVLPCDALRSTMTIDPYGYVIPCAYFYSKIGNIRNYGYNIPLFIKEYLESIRNHIKLIKNNRCPICWTNCEAYPTIFKHPILSLLKYFL